MPWPQLAIVFTAQGSGAAAGGGDSPSLASVVAPYMLVFFAAFFVAIASTPILRRLAIRNGIVDVPDLKRKNHVTPVAYLGGVAIMLGWLAGVAVSYFIEPHNTGTAGIHLQRVVFPLAVILGAGAIVLTGLFDDVYGMSPLVKIGGQLFAAAALASQNVGIRLIEGAFAVLHVEPASILGAEPASMLIYTLGTAVIAVFVIGGCNAVNLLDGLDGLAAGVVALAVMGFLILAAIVAIKGEGTGFEGLVNHPVRIVMCLAILGGVLGFLPYNYNPATIFMGDAGSLLLGYLGVATILMFADVHLKYVTASLIIFALPIIDTLLAMIRRKVRGQPLTAPDDGHIHHQLRTPRPDGPTGRVRDLRGSNPLRRRRRHPRRRRYPVAIRHGRLLRDLRLGHRLRLQPRHPRRRPRQAAVAPRAARSTRLPFPARTGAARRPDPRPGERRRNRRDITCRQAGPLPCLLPTPSAGCDPRHPKPATDSNARTLGPGRACAAQHTGLPRLTSPSPAPARTARAGPSRTGASARPCPAACRAWPRRRGGGRTRRGPRRCSWLCQWSIRAAQTLGTSSRPTRRSHHCSSLTSHVPWCRPSSEPPSLSPYMSGPWPTQPMDLVPGRKHWRSQPVMPIDSAVSP